MKNQIVRKNQILRLKKRNEMKKKLKKFHKLIPEAYF